ncbi:MAG: hypothetical protein CL482_09960 [Acidobacteria bacterium]|nr:hypothetical protein [Acidobacteriota bacterium]
MTPGWSRSCIVRPVGTSGPIDAERFAGKHTRTARFPASTPSKDPIRNDNRLYRTTHCRQVPHQRPPGVERHTGTGESGRGATLDGRKHDQDEPVRPLEWKDTVDIPFERTRRLLVRFEDRPGTWIFHCHILDHAEGGMLSAVQLGLPLSEFRPLADH